MSYNKLFTLRAGMRRPLVAFDAEGKEADSGANPCTAQV